jgi:hypothetical protein
MQHRIYSHKANKIKLIEDFSSTLEMGAASISEMLATT